MKNRKGIMIILDGYGEAEPSEFNAVTNADTPFLKDIKVNKPNCLLKTDSKAVGLPEGTMGGSEVGHMTIGGGKIKKTMQVKIDDEIETGEFFSRKVLVDAITNLKNKNGTLHIAGLWSDKQVHSNIHHCFALIEMAKQFGVKNVFVHAFTDGRDCSPKSSELYFDMFKKFQNEIGLGEIATIGGRFYAMDREKNFDRTALAIEKMKQKDFDFETVKEAVQNSYKQNKTDEFVAPVRIKTENDYNLTENDLLIFFNTRGDRMKQPVGYAKDNLPCEIVTFCNFLDDENVKYVYEEDFLTNGLSEYLSKLKLSQLKVGESTKYAHVTYFFNGGIEKPFPYEERIHIETEKTEDYALTPKMRAEEITKEVVDRLKSKKYDAIIVNYSNPDMVGHTGNYDAIVTALEVVDKCVKKVVECAQGNDYFVLICADHGNAEQMRDENGNPQTAHTLNPVKCVVIDKLHKDIVMHDGGLQDVAPTFLKLMNVKNNPDFEGKPLF